MSSIEKVKEYITAQKTLFEALRKVSQYLHNRNLQAAYLQTQVIEQQNGRLQQLQEELSRDLIMKEERLKSQLQDYQTKIEELIIVNKDLLEIEMSLDKNASNYLSKQVARKKQQELGYLKNGQFNDKAVAVHMPALSYAREI